MRAKSSFFSFLVLSGAVFVPLVHAQTPTEPAPPTTEAPTGPEASINEDSGPIIEAAEPLIDADHPRTYTMELIPDMRQGFRVKLSAVNSVDSVASYKPSPIKKDPYIPLLPSPVIEAEERKKLESQSLIELQIVNIQLRNTPKTHFLLNKTPMEAAKLVQEEEEEGKRLQSDAIQAIEAEGGEIDTYLPASGYVHVTLPVGAILKLSENAGVMSIAEDPVGNFAMVTARAMTHVDNTTNPTDYGFYYLYGKKGQNTVVAIIDTGIDRNHLGLSKLTDGVTNKVQIYEDEVDDGCAAEHLDPYDYKGHGTYVANAAVGSGRGFYGGQAVDKVTFEAITHPNFTFAGMAPESLLRSFKVAIRNGANCTYNDIWADYNKAISAMDKASQQIHDPNYPNDPTKMLPPPDVINTSIGFGTLPADGKDSLSLQADKAFERGVAVFAAVNNFRTNATYNNPILPTYNREIRTGSPAVARKVIGVGAVYTGESTVAIPTDTIDPTAHTPRWKVAPYSDHGPTEENYLPPPNTPPAKGRTKPDLMAPTDVITGFPSPNGPAGGWPLGDYGNIYAGGTSLATPMVSGAAALWVSLYKPTGPIPPGAIYAMLLAGADWTKIIDSSRPYTAGAPNIYSFYNLYTQDNVIGAGVIDLGATSNIPPDGSKTIIDAIGPGVTKSYIVNVPVGAKRLSVAVWWPERKDGAGNTGNYIHTDLDLYLSKGGYNPADGNDDSVWERVGLQNPSAGIWTINVQGHAVPPDGDHGTTQTFYLSQMIRM